MVKAYDSTLYNNMKSHAGISLSSRIKFVEKKNRRGEGEEKQGNVTYKALKKELQKKQCSNFSQMGESKAASYMLKFNADNVQLVL